MSHAVRTYNVNGEFIYESHARFRNERMITHEQIIGTK